MPDDRRPPDLDLPEDFDAAVEALMAVQPPPSGKKAIAAERKVSAAKKPAKGAKKKTAAKKPR